MLIGMIAVVVVLCAALFCAALYFFNFAIVRKPYKQATGETPVLKARNHEISIGKEYLSKLPQETWHIVADDGVKLAATYYPAQNKTAKTVLLVHGYRCMGIEEYAPFARFYHENGYNMLIVDNRAHGKSAGKYIGFGWLDRKDCVEWVNEAARRIGPSCAILLHGISMGAATVLMAGGLAYLPFHVKGIVADCAYASMWEELAYQMKKSFHLPAFPLLHLTSFLCRCKAGYSFGDANTLRQMKNLKVPVLFIHGDADTYVPTNMVYPLYNACASAKALWVVPDAGHAMSYFVAKKEYEARVISFCEKAGL